MLGLGIGLGLGLGLRFGFGFGLGLGLEQSPPRWRETRHFPCSSSPSTVQLM